METIRRKIMNTFNSSIMHLIMMLCCVLPNSTQSNKIRGFLLRPFFSKCGKNFQVASGVIFINPRKMEIGDDVYIAHNSWINGSGYLRIGSNCVISPMVVIATTKHGYHQGMVSNTISEVAPIIIGKGSWIASNSVITKGVTIGNGCIIGACSVVTKDIQDYSFAVGSPAKPTKKLNLD